MSCNKPTVWLLMSLLGEYRIVDIEEKLTSYLVQCLQEDLSCGQMIDYLSKRCLEPTPLKIVYSCVLAP